MKVAKMVSMLTLLALAACTTVSVRNQWSDPSFQGPPAATAVVVGIARNETTRRIFEDTFVGQLTQAGIKAAPAYAEIESGEGGRFKLGDFVRASKADVVIATRVLSVQQKTDVFPSYSPVLYGGFYGWYGTAWVATPTVSQYDVVNLETTVWDPKTEKLIWAATTQRVASRDVPKVTIELAQALIPRMKADHILR